MKIYLCAKFSEQELMKEWRKLLNMNGHDVTSRWLEAVEADLKVEGLDNAIQDLQDINDADLVLSKTLNRGDMFTGGGRHIEFGYAYAKGKPLVNVGGYESIFHKLPQVLTVATIEEAVRYINGQTSL